MLVRDVSHQDDSPECMHSIKIQQKTSEIGVNENIYS